MQCSGWTKAAVLIVAMLSTFVKGEQGKLNPLEADLLSPSETLQVSVLAKEDLPTSATGYGGYGRGNSYGGYEGGNSYSGNRGHGGFHSNKEGFRGHQAHHAAKGDKDSHYGDSGKAQYDSYHDDLGLSSKGSDDRQAYSGDVHSDEKGSQTHHKAAKGHHDKGHKDEGFKNVYHKEEYSHSKDFSDDYDDAKYHNIFDDFDRYFNAQRGNDYKGGHYESGHHHDTHGQKGHQQKAKYHDDHADQDGHYGDQSLSGHKGLYGDHKAQYGHGGHGSSYDQSGHIGKYSHVGHSGGYGRHRHGGGYGHGGGYNSAGSPYRVPTVTRTAPRSFETSGSFGTYDQARH